MAPGCRSRRSSIAIRRFGPHRRSRERTARRSRPADCDLQTRIAAADAYLATRPGSVGYVLRDRKTGAAYRNSHAGDMVWTASTIKLAMVVDLLTRAARGHDLADRRRPAL